MEEIDENPFRRSSSGMDHPHLSRQSGMGVTARVNEVPSVYAALTDALFGMNQSWNGNWNGNGTNNYQRHSTSNEYLSNISVELFGFIPLSSVGKYINEDN